MTPKQNALEIVKFGKPERVVTGAPVYECSYFGVNHEPFEGAGGHNSPVGTRWFDIWGVGWHKELDGVMGYTEVHPLADLSRMDKFAWPNADDERLVSRIYEKAKAADRENFFVLGSHRDTLWERAYMLVGMDNLMMAMYDAPGAVRELFHRIIDFQLGIAKHYAEIGIEMANFSDDLGSQRAPFFSREMLEEFFVPEYKRLMEFHRKRGVIINFHSCGNVEPMADMFMDIGVDILNPVQATANDLDRLRRKTQGRMALQGGVSTHAIMTGPVEAIVKETRTRLWQLGRNGGYFCCPDQGLPFPEAHIQAFRDTVDKWGAYPIHKPE